MQKPSRRRFHPRDGIDSPLLWGEGLGVRVNYTFSTFTLLS
jgi:hypothetical protein